MRYAMLALALLIGISFVFAQQATNEFWIGSWTISTMDYNNPQKLIPGHMNLWADGNKIAGYWWNDDSKEYRTNVTFAIDNGTGDLTGTWLCNSGISGEISLQRTSDNSFRGPYREVPDGRDPGHIARPAVVMMGTKDIAAP